MGDNEDVEEFQEVSFFNSLEIIIFEDYFLIERYIQLLYVGIILSVKLINDSWFLFTIKKKPLPYT